MFFDMLCISHINFPLALYNYVTELLRIVDRSRGTWSLSSGGKSGKNVGSTNKRRKPMIYNALTMLWHSDDINVPRYIHILSIFVEPTLVPLSYLSTRMQSNWRIFFFLQLLFCGSGPPLRSYMHCTITSV